ncbi:MAG: DUF4832 domain-containing protein [Corallococcus sp.]|nr:DUF4832 domain-containing protein [Corallococcus sp.]MCM1359801.1 DUF4832 domain-containing protein [Corallococcus sp.]MCM1395673.1 DUF4832 domain-containing protein [Corallococcus sp.]
MNEKRKKQNSIPKSTKFFCCAIAVLLVLTVVLAIVGSCTDSSSDFGNFRFTEYVGTLSNPGVGYTKTDWYHTAPDSTPVRDTQGDIVLFFVNIGAFSAGANGTTDADGNYVEGRDYDLDEAFFSALSRTLENCRNNGSTVALRFRYDENGKADPEPKTFQQVLNHISQIKQSGILQEYQDILMFVECGFVGKWGEQHGGKYTSLDYKVQLLSAILDCVPYPVPVTVRTPDIFAGYVGISRAELADYVCKTDDELRVGLYNDGYMGSNSDLGTYADRETETAWLGKQTLTSYFGGEFSGNIDFAKQYDTYKPENCLPEMYKTHLSYINGNIFELYKEYTFNKSLDVSGYDNSAYYGQTVWQFIRDHIGYRFVLKNSKISKSVAQGEMLDVSFTLVNNGFANPIKKQDCEILLEKDGNFVRCDVDVDPTVWYSGKTVTETIKIKIPAFLQEGKWNVYFKSSVGNRNMSQFAMRSVRFANNDVFDESLGANYLGNFTVTKSDNADKATDNTISQEGLLPRFAQLYNMGQKVQIDGLVSGGSEWRQSDVVAENGSNKLYLKADEQNLYVMANLPHNSASPVFNLRVVKSASTSENPETTKSYWLYQQTNGYVYFSDPDKVGHVGMQLKYSDEMFEFQVPLYMFGLKSGDELTEISVNVQDSADGWKSTGSLKTVESVAVCCDFVVYNAPMKIKMNVGESVVLELFAESDVQSVTWLHNGKPLAEKIDILTLRTSSKNDAGTYAAQITTVSGNVKTVIVADVDVV